MQKLRLEEAIVHSIKVDFRDCQSATFYQRLAATIIDLMFFSTFLAIYQQVIEAALTLAPNTQTPFYIFFSEMLNYSELLIIILYFLVPQFVSGQTLGKKILKIKIVTMDYGPDVPLPLLCLR